jgi:transposase-like protein
MIEQKHSKKRVFFTDQQKQEAVELVTKHFWKAKWVAEKYGVTENTIYRWGYELDIAHEVE